MSKRRSVSGQWSAVSKNALLYWLPAIIYMSIIFIMSSFPAPEPIKKVPIIYDIKIVHIVEYGVLSVLFVFALLRTTKMSLAQVFWWSVALTVLYGVLDEFHQSLVPGRSCKFTDVIGDLIGAAVFSATALRARIMK